MTKIYENFLTINIIQNILYNIIILSFIDDSSSKEIYAWANATYAWATYA